MRTYAVLALAALCCLCPRSGFAAGAYVVDDGDIVDPGKIQLESWFSHGSDRDNLGVADIAYQALPRTEITIENGYDSNAGYGTDTFLAQAKYQWHENKVGPGIESCAVFGVQQGLTSGGSLLYAYVPSTFTLNDTVDINADLGWQYDASIDHHYVTWGVGSELHADEHWSLLGEVFGRNTLLPGEQIGPRYAVSENLQFDVVYGRNITAVPANWITFGFTAQF